MTTRTLRSPRIGGQKSFQLCIAANKKKRLLFCRINTLSRQELGSFIKEVMTFINEFLQQGEQQDYS